LTQAPQRKLRKRMMAFNRASTETGGPLRRLKRKASLQMIAGREMIATRPNAPSRDYIANIDSPAILRLRMLEMKAALKGPLPEAERRSAFDLLDRLKRSIAEKPSLSFADAVAKLKTLDEIAGDLIGEKADDRQKDSIRRAIAELRRQRLQA
jgi:hypothetical protein